MPDVRVSFCLSQFLWVNLVLDDIYIFILY